MMAPTWVPLALAIVLCLLAGVSSQGFAPVEPTRREFTVYIPDLDFASNSQISDGSSQMFNDAKAAIVDLLKPYGGFVDLVIFKNGSPCVAAHVYWVDVQQGVFQSVLDSIEDLTLTAWNQPWRLSLQGCNPNLHVLVFNLYASGIPWMDDMANHSSSTYTQVKGLVTSHFADLGGKLRTLELRDNNGCIHIFVDWEAEYPEKIIALTSQVKATGFILFGQQITVATRPCPPSAAAVDECPPVPKDTAGICIMGCDDDNPEMACEAGYKCCSNGCGRVCVRVGYKVRVTASVMASGMLPQGIMSNQGGLGPYLELMVKQNFNNAPAAPVVIAAELTRTDIQMLAGRDVSRMNVNIYLSEDLPNSALQQGLYNIEGSTLPSGLEQMRLAQAEFVSHSLFDMRSCGGSMCHGICKHLITGEDYCSCDAGRMGPSCSEFDCRKDPFAAVTNTQDNHCAIGQCVVEPGENAECDCNSGYYGELCNVQVCSMMNDPCGAHGTCVGLVDQGKLCQCDQGWSGIFCNVSSSEDATMTPCQMERRLMQFVHHQVHSRGLAPQLNVFMSTLLRRMDVDEYSLPHCWATGSGRDGEYHSTCTYSAESGYWVQCECLNTLRQPSGYIYFGPGDCRVFSGSGNFWKYDSFYILNMTWSENLLMDDSVVYMEIKNQVSNAAQMYGGGVSHMNFMRGPHHGCIMAGAEWYSTNENEEGKLSQALENSGIMVMGEKKAVSKDGCTASTGGTTGADHVFSYTLYVSGMPRSPDTANNMNDNSSMIYMMAKRAVEAAFSGVGGKLRTLYLSESAHGCVMIFVEWEGISMQSGFAVVNKLKTNGLVYGSQMFPVRMTPCEPTDTSTGGNTGADHVFSYTLYVSGMPRSPDTANNMNDNSSMIYMMAKRAVEAAFSGVGGKLRTLYLSESAHGCVMIFVEWEGISMQSGFDVVNKLKTNGLVYGSQTFPVRMTPCEPTDTVDDGCPAVRPGVAGICVEMCNDDMPCGEGFKCCSNGCGHVCVRVNYKVKVNTMITVDMDMTMHMELLNMSSPLYMNVKQGVENMIREVFELGPKQVLAGIDLRGVSRWRYQNKTYPILNVDLFLMEDLSNDDLQRSAFLLEKARLYNIQGAPDFMAVEFATHSMHNVRACGNVECNGICKTRFSGEDFCSCWPGQRGKGCVSFDCRQDPSDLFSNKDVCEHGLCDLDDSSQTYECDCPPGYHGDRCHVNVCDMTIDACNYRGTCEGLVEEGELCHCDAGWGGIFCERQTSDDASMTTCEKERRLMLFVHGQVTGQAPRSPRIATFMSMLLHRMDSPHYPVPFCWPADPGSPRDREYHSICYHDSSTGDKMYCECVNTDKTPNNMVHYAEGDCRASTGPVSKTEAFFVQTPANASPSSTNQAVINAVRRTLQGLGGRVVNFNINTAKQGCMVVQVIWSTRMQTETTLVDLLLDSPIMIDGQPARVSKELCRDEVDIDSCPVLLPNHMELLINCQAPCTTDEECGDDSKCCDSGCEGTTCTEVGFRDKIVANITVDLDWTDILQDPESIAYLIVKSTIETNLDVEMKRKEVRGYMSAKVLAFFPVTMPSETGSRAKRQARVLLGMTIELKFNSTLPVESLVDIQTDLLENGLSTTDGQVYRLKRVRLGRTEADLETGEEYMPCGFYRCDPGSLCVESVGGIEYCACPKGRTGPSCGIHDCVTADGDDLCENGGTCQSAPSGMEGGHCKCSMGYFGQFCQAKMCEHLANNACGSGKCIGEAETPAFCRCPPGTGGLFCELARPDPVSMTTCQKARRMSQYIVNVWKGLDSDTRILDVDEFVKILVHHGSLAVSKCWENDTLKNGAYHSMCQYDMKTKQLSSCVCLDEEGNANYWDYDYETGQCRVYTETCDNIKCHNGGTCVSMPNGRDYCECPQGYSGMACEMEAEGKCPGGSMPLMTDKEALQCRMAPCPMGFSCNAHPADQWTVCCFDEGFLCKINPCQSGGSCVGNFMTGHLCDCPAGSGGMLCETTTPDGEMTACQTSQRFYDTLISVLSGGASPLPNLNLQDLRRILMHNEMEWLPKDMCDTEGQFKSVTEAVHVLNTVQTKQICLDNAGMPDPSCRAATCHLLSVGGQMEVCENGGVCVGDVRHRLCDCTGTGHHGFRCHLPGRSRNESSCTLGRDIAMFALNVLYNASQPEILREQMDKVITLHGDAKSGVFVPSCDASGRFEFRGCVHPREGRRSPTCYCATPDGEMVGNEVRMMSPPDNCEGGTDDRCPREWGKECIKPHWWCSNTMKCRKNERCSYLASPEGQVIECVSNTTVLPCDHHPCEDNPYAQCSPCGVHGRCYNTIMSQGHGNNMSMPGKDRPGMGDSSMNQPQGNRPSMMRAMSRSSSAVMMCSCQVGFSGKYCDVNTEVCATVPSFLCEQGCMGDIDRGYLCRCPKGMAGIFCNKPVGSECERRKALFDDAIDILEDNMHVDGYDNDQLKTLISVLVRLEGGNEIPRLNCTHTGLYAKIQCHYNLDTESEWCFCADQQGDYISSNVEPYIDYDVCTANGDLRELDYCNEENPIGKNLCLNGGECAVDIYNGHVCDCPDGYSGAFCEMNRESEEEARSLCEFMTGAFDSLHNINIGMSGQVSVAQMAAIMNVSAGFLFPYKDYMYFVRPDCTAEGGFASSAVCYYNVQTREKGDCFCWGANGPDYHRMVQPEEDPFTVCSSAEEMHCKDKVHEECPDLKCAGGHRTDLTGCPVCSCKHPCEDLHCKRGERCQVDPSKCHMSMGDMSMEKHKSKGCAMCVPIHKPGVCPDYNLAAYGSILGGGLTRSGASDSEAMGSDSNEGNKDGDDDNDSAERREREATCSRVTCRDDADCPGKKKCCGLCGNKCVDPVETFTCAEEAAKMSAYIMFLKEVEKALVQGQSQTDALPHNTRTTLNRIGSIPHVWRPSCESDGHLFKPLQCEYSLEELTSDKTPVPHHCFCVDRLGMRLPGTEGADPNDASACLTKPGVCPYLTYGMGDDDDRMFSQHTCTSDVDCLGKNKCCSNGVGMVCVPAAKKPKMAMVDRLMQGLCKINSSRCKGFCMGDWETEGQSCRCGVRGRYGPFCEQILGVEYPRYDTVCRQKSVAITVFETQFYEHETNPQGIVLLYEDYISQMYEAMDDYNWMDEELTMVRYECTSEGGFQPMQCVRDVNSWQDIACFCVDENGQELIGTRKHAKDGLPRCGGNNERMCPIGYPLHGSDGEMLMCGPNDGGCPMGYNCTRGAYGRQHCCMTRQGAQNSCHLPADVGMNCEAGMRGQPPGTRYYFNGQQCAQFAFKGCGGNRNNFGSLARCEQRCKARVHEGSCPAQPFTVNVNAAGGSRCKNYCNEDRDCDVTHKCCQSSCGRHCFPAIAESVDRGMCPYGQPKSFCRSTQDCPAGHYCKTESIEGGMCCTDYNNVNMCDIQPSYDEVCSEPTARFFYNATSMMCEQFTFTGCAPDFNNFKTHDECCGACNGRGRCKPGKCSAVRPGPAISCTDECSADSSCRGTQICCSNGCSKTCVAPQVEMPSDCFERRNAALKRESVSMGSANHCNPVDIPECDASGYWSMQQCHKAFGLCWCVTPMGNFIRDTLTRGPAACTGFTALDIARADQMEVDPSTAQLEVCPHNQTLHCCPRSLCERSCRKYPRAHCQINPCGGCMPEYYVDGQQVDCSAGLSQCEADLKEAATALQEQRITTKRMRMGDNVDYNIDEDLYDEEPSTEDKPPFQSRSIRPGIPLRCQLPPVTGPCRGYARKWYYNPTMGACSMFVWGMCGGNLNRFDSPEECYTACNTKADPCMNITCPRGQECKHVFDKDCYTSKKMCEVTATCAEMVNANHASGVFIPRCEQDGDYSYKQCHDQYCWCVDESGHYKDGLTTKTSQLTCTANGMTASSVVTVEACPNGRQPNISCVKKACTHQVCPGSPEATCKVDLCSDNCAVSFVDGENGEVDCAGNKCDVFKFDQDDREECSAKLSCQGGNVRNCPESVCHSALHSCNLNPCAVCSVDPCTCQPYFVDTITGERLTQEQCRFISLGVCQAKTCQLLTQRSEARLSGEAVNSSSLPLPQCDQEGRFEPRQCNGEDCVCVNELGAPVGEPSGGSCQEIDEVVKVEATLTFQGNLVDLNTPSKIQSFKNAILDKLRESGINPANVKLGEPYQGSIKIDVQIVQNATQTRQSRQNIALASNSLKQLVESGNLDIDVDGQQFSLDTDATVVTPQTASQVGGGATTTTSTPTTARPADTGSDSDLSDTDKIIIGATCGGVGLLILIIICYCVCCRSRQKESPPDDTYDHIRTSNNGSKDNTYDKPAALYNPTFEEDGHYMKVRM